MGMINADIINTVPMPIKVGTQHRFCDLLLWTCAKRH